MQPGSGQKFASNCTTFGRTNPNRFPRWPPSAIARGGLAMQRIRPYPLS
jgi:hypothetical protein